MIWILGNIKLTGILSGSLFPRIELSNGLMPLSGEQLSAKAIRLGWLINNRRLFCRPPRPLSVGDAWLPELILVLHLVIGSHSIFWSLRDRGRVRYIVGVGLVRVHPARHKGIRAYSLEIYRLPCHYCLLVVDSFLPELFVLHLGVGYKFVKVWGFL